MSDKGKGERERQTERKGDDACVCMTPAAHCLEQCLDNNTFEDRKQKPAKVHIITMWHDHGTYRRGLLFFCTSFKIIKHPASSSMFLSKRTFGYKTH